ncbi:MAG: ABC transporter permease [Blastocatellales bacterium]|nr:ABC transporter permease [Blastocatellales bacterium]
MNGKNQSFRSFGMFRVFRGFSSVRLIRLIGLMVPRRLRSDWRQEWEAEMRHREIMLEDWDRLDRGNKLDLLRRSLWAFWDALLLQPRRLEDEVFQDLRYGVRMLLKQPGFTVIAVLTLALGIGANTAVFSVVNALLLRPIPYPASERLVWVEEVSKQTNTSEPAYGAHFLEWQEHSQTLDGIAAIDGATRTLSGAGEAERVACGIASASLLPLLGAEPLGRNFTAAEDSPGGERVAILSYTLWQRRFNSDPSIVGGTITLNDANFTVVGILPANFRFIYPVDVWVPLALDRQAQLIGESRYYGTTIARLKDGVSAMQAQAEMDALLQRYELTRPEGRARIESRTQLIALRQHLLGDTRRPLLVLSGAVALVLLIACANVANLMLARTAARQKELAIRAAMGAGRLRLTRQMLTECLLLSSTGGAAGLLLAWWLTGLFDSLNSAGAIGEMGRLATISIDLSVLGFTLLVTLLTGLFFGLPPALQLSRPDLHVTLKENSGGVGVRGRSFRGMLMVSEVALAIILLVGAGLLIRSFIKLTDVDPGYRAENLLTARVALPPRYNEGGRLPQFYDQLLPRLAALPGVASAGATSHLPLTRYNLGGALRVEGRTLQLGERDPMAPIAAVSTDYFRTMNIPLRAGRVFNDGDTEGAPSVAVFSETLARRLFPNEDPIGKRLVVSASGAAMTTIVGVVGDIRHQGLDQEIEQGVYLSYRQTPRGMSIVLRTTVEPSSLAGALRNAVREIDPALPLYEVMAMNERLSNSVVARRFNLLLLGGFAVLALALAGIGVYGVISYVITQRRREIGIRMALGAQKSDVLRLFVGQGMKLVAIGAAIGLFGAFALTRVMTSLLFDISANDPLTFASVASLLLLVALTACYFPVRRAAKVDPLAALRG